MKRQIFGFLALPLLVSLMWACTSGFGGNRAQADRQLPAKDSLLLKGEASRNEYLVNAVLYHQKAAEVMALSYQAFNLADMMLEKDLRNKKVTGRRAIVLDIDETVLDNSPYEAQLVLRNIAYPADWNNWCNKAAAKAIPGSVDFLKKAASKGVDIFYVTNRKPALKERTMRNLDSLGFPCVDEKHMFFQSGESSKQGRRETIAKDYHIVLFLGDNLADFSNVFENKSAEGRFLEADRLKQEWGTRFIVLPNAMYGDWEGAVFNYDYKKTDEEKILIRHQNLKGF